MRRQITFQRNCNTTPRWQDYITKVHNALVAIGCEYIPIAGDLDLASALPPSNNSFARGGRLYSVGTPSLPLYLRWTPTVTRSSDVPSLGSVETGFSYNPTTGALTGNKSVELWSSGSNMTQPTDGDARTYLCKGDGYVQVLHNISEQTRNNSEVVTLESPITETGNSARGVLLGHYYAVGGNMSLQQAVPRVGSVPTHYGGSDLVSARPPSALDAWLPWDWTWSGNTEKVFVPSPPLPFFGQLGVSRVQHLPVAKASAEAVCNIGVDSIPHMYGGDRGPLWSDPSMGMAIRWEGPDA